MRWLFLAALALVALAVMSSSLTWRRSIARKKLAEVVGRDKVIDFGLELRVVRQDLVHGEELIEGAPRLTVIRSHRMGGMLQVGRPGRPACFIGPSRNPHVIYCSEDAEPIILHGDDLPDRLLVYGSEGAGKTRVLAQWYVVRALEATGTKHAILATSPTTDRSEEVKEALEEMMPPRWFHWNERKRTFRLRNDCRIVLKSTHQSSKKAGSRVQTFNCRAAGSDEIQDQLEADPDIEMRGRKAPNGRYKRLCTATSKDAPDFRTWRDTALGSGMWQKRILFGPRSPFVHPRFWADKEKTLSKREKRRRIDCEDLPPENRVYYGFERERNLIVRPEVARDVTADVASIFRSYHRKHAHFPLIAGHDPGEIRNTTTLHKAYWYQDDILWLVVGRFITERTTAEQHARAFKLHLQAEWGLNFDPDPYDLDAGAARCLVLRDPHGRGETKTGGQTVDIAFRAEKLDIFSAAGDEQIILGKDRRDMVNRLLDPQVGPARLAVATEMDGTNAAPELVAAFEQLERDERGQAEKGPKSETDQTHDPVSVGYALWPFEAPAMRPQTRKRALKAVRA